MPAQGFSRGFLRESLHVDRGCVIVVDSVEEREINEPVDDFLIGNVLAAVIFLHREPHAAVAQQGHFVTVAGVGPHFHLPCGWIFFLACQFCGSLFRCACPGKGGCTCQCGPFRSNPDEISSADILFHGV